MDPLIHEDLQTIKKSIRPESFDGKNVLVTGGAGFLGSWICDVLTMSGSRVVCLDNLSTGVFDNVEHLKGTKSFEFEKVDTCEYSGRKKFDFIFHMASRPAPEDYQKHPVETAQANSLGTQQVLEMARKSDARVFYASSSEVYGDPEVFPTPESYVGRVDPLGPRSCYEEGKRFGESYCKAYSDEYGVEVRIGRIFNSYGPRLRAEGFYGRVVSRFLLQAFKGDAVTVFGDGSQTRSFCYVTDTIIGLLRLVGKEGVSGQAVNIGSEVETNIIDLANKIIQISDSKSRVEFLPFPPGDHHRRLPDGRKAKMILDWGPNIGLEEGLDRSVRWLRAQPNETT
jgi:UDP-glucuronate decarboxylase